MRFTVGSVSGYSIVNASGDGGRHYATIWYVHDKLDCYQIVQEFKGPNAHARALRLADKLNTEPAPPLDAWRVGLAPLCSNGHEMTEENTRWWYRRGKPRPQRLCVECAEQRKERRRERKAAA